MSANRESMHFVHYQSCHTMLNLLETNQLGLLRSWLRALATANQNQVSAEFETARKQRVQNKRARTLRGSPHSFVTDLSKLSKDEMFLYRIRIRNERLTLFGKEGPLRWAPNQ